MRFEPTNREEVHIVLTLEEAEAWLWSEPELTGPDWSVGWSDAEMAELRAAIEQARRDSEPVEP